MKHNHMRITTAIISSTILITLLSGCGGSSVETLTPNNANSTQSDNKNAHKSEKSADSANKVTQLQKTVAKGYMKFVDNPSEAFVLAHSDVLNGQQNITYQYALVNIGNTAFPQLLIKAQLPVTSENGDIRHIILLTYNTQEKKFIAEGNIVAGVGPTSLRGGIRVFKNGNGLINTLFASGTGEGEITTYTVNDNKIIADSQLFSLYDEINTPEGKTLAKFKEAITENISWVNTNNKDSLRAMEKNPWKSTATLTSNDVKTIARKYGYQALTGTVKVLSAQDMSKILHEQDTISDDTSTYAILQFDSPQTVEGLAGENHMDKRKSSMVSLETFENNQEFQQEFQENLNYWQAYNNKKITIVVNPQKSMWPSVARPLYVNILTVLDK